MDEVIQISYLFLAPLSVTSEILLIYTFWRLSQFKDHPEIMIFWQCLSQIILDIHWVTGVKSIKSSLSPFQCCLLGAVCIYFYYLSWAYNLFLSIEILLKISQPHETHYKRRLLYYHIISHLSSLIIFLIIITSKTNGDSLMSTCFIEKHSQYESIILIPALFHFPLCVGIVLYTIYISYNTYYAIYLKYHMLVVLTFSITWVPVGLAHGIVSLNPETIIPLWFICLAAVLGALSGFLVCIARLAQDGLLNKIYMSMCAPKVFNRTLTITLRAPDVSEAEKMESYSVLFEKMTSFGIKNILLALMNVWKSTSEPVAEGNFREWVFNLGQMKTFTKVTQMHVNFVDRIMKKFKVSFADLIKYLLGRAFELDSRMEDIEDRVFTSKGKSGAFFYFSCDGQFIIKAINKNELSVFSEIVKEYTDRVCSDSGSFFAKVFGVFKVKFGKGRAFVLIVMENLSGSLVDPLLFDIKGSTKGRRSSLLVFNDESLMPRNVVYKDLDFVDNIENLVVSDDDFSIIMETLRKDTELLMNYKIMDYSLLVVIGQIKQLRSTAVNRVRINIHNNRIVFIGIIDYLQCFNIRKKIESKYKTLKEESEPSCIAPVPYQGRFFAKVNKIFKKASM